MPTKRRYLQFFILAGLLLLPGSGCSRTFYDRNSICSTCHLTSISCHLDKQIDIQALRAAWRNSFHNSLQEETFDSCPHLTCSRCHPRLRDLEIRERDMRSL
ncbi:MAG: hypothetical protein A2010_04660 [Nitrospirae bacterium GWD2_57_9]|nr:MAG: hypothetical protein A2010_04660 [Nitrospirae bacterium GWD2_57_9]OGW46716.1 MAG: hypothetical protein A2078_08365 [Nitrospirae bacterium GWC2_57_9]